MKSFLPKMTAPVLSKIDLTAVLPMCLGEAGAQPILFPWHHHEVNVIGHQAIRPDRGFMLPACFGHQLQIQAIVVVGEKRFLVPVAALGDVVGVFGQNDSSDTGHGSIGVAGTKISILSRIDERAMSNVPANRHWLRWNELSIM